MTPLERLLEVVDDAIAAVRECASCSGTGGGGEEPCGVCRGRGLISAEAALELVRVAATWARREPRPRPAASPAPLASSLQAAPDPDAWMDSHDPTYPAESYWKYVRDRIETEGLVPARVWIESNGTRPLRYALVAEEAAGQPTQRRAYYQTRGWAERQGERRYCVVVWLKESGRLVGYRRPPLPITALRLA